MPAAASCSPILRFSAGHCRLLDVLKAGEIGTLLRFASRRYRDAGHASRYVGIDPILMTMIHDIDLALWFDGGEALRAGAFRGDAGEGRSLTSAWLEKFQQGGSASRDRLAASRTRLPGGPC